VSETAVVTTTQYDALGYRFTVDSRESQASALIARLLAGMTRTDMTTCRYVISRADGGYELSVDGERIVGPATPSQVLMNLMSSVNRAAVDAGRDHHVMFHASAVARGGDAVICPAPMESGKTTLAAGLVRAGLDYVTDEAVAVDPNGLGIRAYPKPLSIDPGSWATLADLEPMPSEWMAQQWQVPATDIRPGALAGPCSPRFIVAPRYEPNGTTRLTPISRSDAVILLAENSFNFNDDGRRWLPVLGDIVRACECYRMSIADLDDACALVTGLFDR
jgi:hypothetical protein